MFKAVVPPDPSVLLRRPKTNAKSVAPNSRWVRQTTRGSIYSTGTDNWHLLNKKQMRGLDTESLERYVQMFNKEDEEESEEQSQRNRN